MLHLKSDYRTGQNDQFERFKKHILGAKFGVRFKFEDKNGFKFIIFINPENIGHLDIFLSEKWQLVRGNCI